MQALKSLLMQNLSCIIYAISINITQLLVNVTYTVYSIFAT